MDKIDSLTISQDHLDRLIREITSLTSPPHLSYLAENASGLFMPGFMALPAVTIVGKSSWRGNLQDEVEVWKLGDLISLTNIALSAENENVSKVYFTPVGDVTLPLIDVTTIEEKVKFKSTFLLTPKVQWEASEIQCAFLPWTFDESGALLGNEEMLQLSDQLELSRRELIIHASIGNEKLEVDPLWGLANYGPSTTLDSIRFPLTHARQSISPFIFRLRFNNVMHTIDGNRIAIGRDPIKLHFEFSEKAWHHLYQSAVLPKPRNPGISIHINVLPLADIDLKSWPQGDSFNQFVQGSGMKPLGVAGVFPYKLQNKKEKPKPVNIRSNIFSFEIDRSGMILNTYSIPGDNTSAQEKQLIMWMSHGSEINTNNYAYARNATTQPMEKSSHLLDKASTIMACFGGMECFPPSKTDIYSDLMINVSNVPQLFAFREGLSLVVQDLVERLGYERVTVDGPYSEIRLMNNMRRQVVAVYLKNPGGLPMEKRHLRSIHQYIEERSPIGTSVVVEEAV